MDQQFTDGANYIITNATAEAAGLSHPDVGSEQVLLALISCNDRILRETLELLCVEPVWVREKIMASSPRLANTGVFLGTPQPLSPRVKQALQFAVEEAAHRGDSLVDGDVLVGPEHILLGLIRAGGDTIAGILGEGDVALQRARAAVEIARSPVVPPSGEVSPASPPRAKSSCSCHPDPKPVDIVADFIAALADHKLPLESIRQMIVVAHEYRERECSGTRYDLYRELAEGLLDA